MYTSTHFSFVCTASEIALRGGRSGKVLDVLRYETPGYRQDSTNSNSGKKEMNHNQMRLHLQNMELELSNVLGSVRSNAFASEKVHSTIYMLSFPILELERDLNKV